MFTVSFIGSGNVATHLAKKLHAKGVTIHQVLSKNIENANNLAIQVKANGISDFLDLQLNNVDVLIVAVSDDNLSEISKKIPAKNCIVAHTSGTREMEVLNTHANYGVFYPLQTFSKTKEIDLAATPFCIEGNSEAVSSDLSKLAALISTKVEKVDSETRKTIHIAAVFACNFSNHMLAISHKLLGESNVELSILQPLVEETIHKAFTANPSDVQTGPAARNDQKVMEAHLSRLASDEVLQTIYSTISQSIIKTKNE